MIGISKVQDFGNFELSPLRLSTDDKSPVTGKKSKTKTNDKLNHFNFTKGAHTKVNY